MLAPAVVGWLFLAAATAVFMGRRGHDRFEWGFLGLALGPLVVPLALSARRRAAPDPEPRERPGKCDVLVAVDRNADADALLDEAVVLIGAKATSITLVTVVDLDAPDSPRGRDVEREVGRRLAGLAARVREAAPAPVDTIVVHGNPVDRLAHLAARGGFELVVVGSGRHGIARRTLGGVARGLARRVPVPVLVAPAGA